MRLRRLIGTITNVALSICAMVVTAAVVRQQMRPRDNEGPLPSQVSGWRALAAHGHRLGSVTAPVSIVEFSDFQCPYCALAESTLRSIRTRYPRDVALIYRHFPLVTIHPFAMAAAAASECAADQDRFAEFHDLLFRERDSIGRKSWSAFALSAGITDPNKFVTCMGSSEAASRVEADMAVGRKLHIQVTPTLIVNDSLFPGAPAEQELARIVDAALARSRSHGIDAGRD